MKKGKLLILVIILVCLSNVLPVSATSCPPANTGFHFVGSVDITPPEIWPCYCHTMCSIFEFWRVQHWCDGHQRLQCTYQRNTSPYDTYNTIQDNYYTSQYGCC